MTDLRTDRKHNRKGVLQNSRRAHVRQGLIKGAKDSGWNVDAVTKVLRSHMPDSRTRNKAAFDNTGEPGGESLRIANKVLVQALDDVLRVFKQTAKYIDPLRALDKDQQGDPMEPTKLQESRRQWALRYLNETRRNAQQVKQLLDGLTKLAKVAADAEIDTAPDRLTITGVSSVRDAFAGDAETVH